MDKHCGYLIGHFLLLICFCWTSCNQQKTKTIAQADREALAKARCSSCHQFPTPALLDKNTWQQYVLPRMGYFMGIYSESEPRAKLIEANFGGQLVEKANIFPESPTISTEEWQAIQSFYLENAPDTLEKLQKTIQKNLPNFKVKTPAYQLSPPATTFVGFSANQQLLIGDASKNSLFLFNKNLELMNIAKLGEGIVQIEEMSNSFLVTTMGSFSPTDNPKGKIYALPKNGQPRVLLDSLQRPVHTQFKDIDSDGYMDIVVAEFGKWTGGLSWFKNLNNQGFEKRTLRAQPGAISVYVEDLNDDQLPDILGLFGQGAEGIFIFENQGNGQFEEYEVLTFPASYGSSNCSLFDFNEDGRLDILYTAGDNADYPAVAKPYHGIRIFQNEGNYQFKEVFFYPLNGAYKAIPNDFDKDGDIDLAAISFFPDFDNLIEEGFVLLDNQGGFKFDAFSFPQVNQGRWLVMNTGDMEGDGDVDIVLGSLTLEVPNRKDLVVQWVEVGLPFLVLENQLY